MFAAGVIPAAAGQTPIDVMSATDLLDPAASDDTTDNARDGARKRRDPNEPVAVVGLGASA